MLDVKNMSRQYKLQLCVWFRLKRTSESFSRLQFPVVCHGGIIQVLLSYFCTTRQKQWNCTVAYLQLWNPGFMSSITKRRAWCIYSIIQREKLWTNFKSIWKQALGCWKNMKGHIFKQSDGSFYWRQIWLFSKWLWWIPWRANQINIWKQYRLTASGEREVHQALR